MQIELKCPECRGPMALENPRCPSGHRFEMDDGVLVLMSEQRRIEMDEYLSLFREYRTGREERITDPAIYDRLPFNPQLKRDPLWRLRRHDARLADRLLRNRPRSRILDLGAWNCWLSHHLAIGGHDVVAVDDFDDPYDGLHALKHYSSGKWVTIRMDLDRIELLEAEFDLIIVNRALSMLSEPFRVLGILQQRLASRGRLLLTGLNIFHKSTSIQDHYARLREDFRARHGREIGFKPFKGYLDRGDTSRLREMNVIIRPYWQLMHANVRTVFMPSRPRHCYGLYTRS